MNKTCISSLHFFHGDNNRFYLEVFFLVGSVEISSLRSRYDCDAVSLNSSIEFRPCQLKLQDSPKMARAALSRRAIDIQCGVVSRLSGAMPVCCLEAREAAYSPYRAPLDGPFRWAKNGPYQMRRHDCIINRYVFNRPLHLFLLYM